MTPVLRFWLTNAGIVVGVLLLSWALYRLACHVVLSEEQDKSRVYRLRSLFRFLAVVLAGSLLFALLTKEWLGLLVSLGFIGFGVTFVLQQPLLSLVGWMYITVRKPFEAGDRIQMAEVKGEVISIDLLLTTLLEVDGDLVSSNQPSGVLVTIPNSMVLSSQVRNYTSERFPWVWNEISLQVSYESDLELATEVMQETATDYVGDQMEEIIDDYRRFLEGTPLEIDLRQHPTVNITQRESWVELRLRYLVHPRKGQTTKNELYRRILDQINEHPDRISFPVSRNR